MNSPAWRLTCEADLAKQGLSAHGLLQEIQVRVWKRACRQVRKTIPQHITMAQ